MCSTHQITIHAVYNFLAIAEFIRIIFVFQRFSVHSLSYNIIHIVLNQTVWIFTKVNVRWLQYTRQDLVN